jgi:rod shape-determining protein MreC
MAARGEGGSDTLRLLVYLALALAMMVSDHRGGMLARVRQNAAVAVQPLWWLASVPGRITATVHDAVANQTRLTHENTDLQQQLLLLRARMERLQSLRDENQQLRALLGGTRALQISVQLASILNIDLDSERQRVVLDVGSSQGVHVGQVLIDAGGVLGQVIVVTPTRATALLITDPTQAIPVQAIRSGLRLIAFGTGRSDQLSVPNIPQSGDLKVGDVLITSGIGGRFPAGFPVGSVATLRPDANNAFVAATLTPAARLDRSGQVLLVWNLPDESPDGPPVPADLAARRAAAAAALLKTNAGTAAQPQPIPQSATPAESKPSANASASDTSAPQKPEPRR